MSRSPASAGLSGGRRLLCGALLCAVTLPAGAAESLQSLRYGAVLYHYYQQHYFEALSELMAAQQAAELGGHESSAELLRGGMSLSYGLPLQAEKIFNEQLNPASDEGLVAGSANHDRAWFYLARMEWQRGRKVRAVAMLDHVGDQLASELRDEAFYMRAQVALEADDSEQAARYAQQIGAGSPWRSYYYYGVGAGLAASGDWQSAARNFRQVEPERTAPEDVRALADRAYTASGFALMAAGEYQQAATDFNRVRLHGQQSQRAMLGLGWSASAQSDYSAALAPWLHLTALDPASDSVRESLLAVPYAYEQLGRDNLALQHYQRADRILTGELERISEAQQAFAYDPLAPLLDPTLGARMGAAPGSHYLTQLDASHAYQNSLREWRDLRQMERRLTQAASRLEVLAEVDAEQQSVWQDLIEQDTQQQLAQRRQQLEEVASTLRVRLDRALEHRDGRALATAEQMDLWRRLERAQSLNSRLQQDDKQINAQRLELLRGLMVWQDSEQYPQRAWQHQRSLRELERLLADSAAAQQRVSETVARRESTSYRTTIDQLGLRLLGLREQQASALAATEVQLRQVALAELKVHEQALSRTLGQSRLAVARLYDPLNKNRQQRRADPGAEVAP